MKTIGRNEVSWLRKHYEIKETDCEIKKYKMQKWKILLKNKVKEKVFSELCLEVQSKTKLKNLKYEFLERGLLICYQTSSQNSKTGIQN